MRNDVTHAEMVAGVRSLLVEMMAEVDRVRAMMPVSAVLQAKLAERQFKNELYGEAADNARAAIARLRGVPAGAVELSSYEWAALQGCAIDSATSLRLEPSVRMTKKERQDRTKLLKTLDKLTEMLDAARAVYIVSSTKADE
jgi:hypothetical protein